MRIALLITCLTETYYPRVGAAVVKVLEHLGHEVVFPEAQTCCGQPMYNTGHHNEARRAAAHTIRVFESYEVVVTPSGSCAGMVRTQYGHLFEHDPVMTVAAARMAGKTFEFVEFLMKVLRVDVAKLGIRWEGRAALHAACHMRELGLFHEPEAVLKQIAGVEYSPIERMDQCCGFGGTFAVEYPVISGQMVRDKVACIAKTGAGTLVCNEAGCAMNIEGACRRGGVDVRMVSIAEIIAEGLGLLPREGGGA